MADSVAMAVNAPAVIRRRSVGLALAAIAAGAGMASGQEPSPPVPMVPARLVRNGWGVCGRPGIDAGIDAYAAMMGQLGTRDIRGPLVQGGVSARKGFEDLRVALVRAGLGPRLRVTALAGAYLNDQATTWQGQQAALLACAATGMLRAIEGPNEINNRVAGNGAHGPDDMTDCTGPDRVPGNFRAWAEALHGFRLRHAAALSGVSLIAPSIASGLRSDYARLPDVTALVDAANFHFYAGAGRQPGFSMMPNPEVGSFGNVLAWARNAQKPAGPVWVTEAGATTSGLYARDGISQAKYLANQLFDCFASGGARIFFYQLIDGSGREGDSEGNFGLFHRDGSPKPAAIMFAGLKHLLSLGAYDDPRNDADTAPLAPGFDTRGLAVVGPTGTPPPRLLAMPKSDGSTMIAVWNEPVIDDGHGRSLTPASQTCSVDFGATLRFRIHDIMAPAPASGFRSGNGVHLALVGHPALIELRPVGDGSEGK